MDDNMKQLITARASCELTSVNYRPGYTADK